MLRFYTHQLCLYFASLHMNDAARSLLLRDEAIAEGWHAREVELTRDHDVAIGKARWWTSKAWRVA